MRANFREEADVAYPGMPQTGVLSGRISGRRQEVDDALKRSIKRSPMARDRTWENARHVWSVLLEPGAKIGQHWPTFAQLWPNSGAFESLPQIRAQSSNLGVIESRRNLVPRALFVREEPGLERPETPQTGFFTKTRALSTKSHPNPSSGRHEK